MPERNYYVICDDNCKFEGMTKEQILSAIQQAVDEHGTRQITVPAIDSVNELNHKGSLSLWIGTEDEYDALTPQNNVLYIIAEHNSEKSELMTDIQELSATVDSIYPDVELIQNNVNELSGILNYQKQIRNDLRENISGTRERTNSLSNVAFEQIERTVPIDSALSGYLESKERQTVLFNGEKTLSTTETRIDVDWDNFNELIFVFKLNGNNMNEAFVMHRIFNHELAYKTVGVYLQNIDDSGIIGRIHQTCLIEFIDTGGAGEEVSHFVRIRKANYQRTCKLYKIIGVG